MKTELNITIPQDILDFLDVVVSKTKGYQVYLGGGFLRDLYFNQVVNKGEPAGRLTYNIPKDLDLFFVPNKYFNLGNELPVIAKSYINYDTIAEDFPDMQERGVAKVRGMFMSSLSTKDVQFIVYDNVFVSPDHLAADMDMNINQIMYDPVDKVFYVSDAFLSGHADKVIECLHTFDETRMYNRYKRMMLKFPEYSVVTSLDMEYHDTVVKIRPEKSDTSGASFID